LKTKENVAGQEANKGNERFQKETNDVLKREYSQWPDEEISRRTDEAVQRGLRDGEEAGGQATLDGKSDEEYLADKSPLELSPEEREKYYPEFKDKSYEVNEDTIAYGPKEGKDHPVYFSLNVPSECLVLDGPGSLTPYGNGRESTSRDGKAETPEDG